jgi:hypothetical protein
MKYIKSLSDEEREYLLKLIKTSTNHRTRQRAHAIILSEKKFPVETISSIFDVHRDTVSRWIDVWQYQGVNGLYDAPKPGRPRINLSNVTDSTNKKKS